MAGLEHLQELLDELDNDISVDPDELDVLWLDQPNTYYKYADPLSEAMSERNRLKRLAKRRKDELETVKARVNFEIRQNPEEYDLPKVTDVTVAAAVLLTEDYREAYERYMEAEEAADQAQYVVNKLDAAVGAVSEKKSALEQLARLAGMGYYSTPNEPKDLGQKYREKVERESAEAKRKVRDRQRRRR